jgi:RNA polymerase sigma factor (sigma-70 family)
MGLASRYATNGIAREDLVAEGYLGMLRAAELFDPSRGNTFRTYARFWVRAFMLRFIEKNRRPVAGPSSRGLRLAMMRYHRVRRQLEQERGGAVTRDEIAARMGVSVTLIDEAQALLGSRDVSIDTPDSDSHEARWDPIAAEANAEERTLERDALHGERMRRAFAILSDRERRIVTERWIDGGRTLEDIGRELGVSRERVRQIEQKAFDKLRRELVDRATPRRTQPPPRAAFARPAQSVQAASMAFVQ